MEFLIPLLPILTQIFGAKLIAKDKNDTGADDEIGKILIDISPVTTELVANKAPKQELLDVMFTALFKRAGKYLSGRGMLSGDVPEVLPAPIATQ